MMCHHLERAAELLELLWLRRELGDSQDVVQVLGGLGLAEREHREADLLEVAVGQNVPSKATTHELERLHS